MRILFCVRHNFHTSPGGAQIQILKTIEGLRKLGCQCELTTEPEKCNIKEFDIVNLTDLTWIYELSRYIRYFKQFNIPIVLTTIYWPLDDYVRHAAPFLQRKLFQIFGINATERFKALYKLLRQRDRIYWQGILRNYISTQREIVNSVDWMLPNSYMEQNALNNRLQTSCTNFSVVNNAIDLSAFKKVQETAILSREDDLILFVGRIDPRKNQINFLKAIFDLPYRICFIGQAGPNSKYYYGQLRELGRQHGRTEFVSQIPQEKVFEYMLKAKAHALTSWVETPGLVSLEAYYAGCNIVVADKGSVREYFDETAYYCNPADLASIRNSVIRAMSSPYSDALKKRIEEEYSWDFAAKQTYDAYKKVKQYKNLVK